MHSSGAWRVCQPQPSDHPEIPIEANAVGVGRPSSRAQRPACRGRWARRPTRQGLEHNLSERWGGYAARRGDCRMARRLDRQPVGVGVCWRCRSCWPCCCPDAPWGGMSTDQAKATIIDKLLYRQLPAHYSLLLGLSSPILSSILTPSLGEHMAQQCQGRDRPIQCHEGLGGF
jgi:hypothetical protein